MLCRGKPLRQVTKATGEEWGRPSPDVEVKAAALKVRVGAWPGKPFLRLQVFKSSRTEAT